MREYERDPELADEVNDTLELLHQRIEVPGNCVRHMAMEVTGSWDEVQREEARAWITNGGEEPDHVYELRKSFARIQGIDPSRIRRLEE